MPIYGVEMAFTATGTLMVLVMLMTLTRSTVLHVNSSRPVGNLAVQFLIYSAVRLTEYILIPYYHAEKWSVSPYEWEPTSPFFYTGSMTFFFTMVGALCLPAFALERLCATRFVADYETNERKWISVLSISATILVSSVLAFFYMIGIYSRNRREVKYIKFRAHSSMVYGSWRWSARSSCDYGWFC